MLLLCYDNGDEGSVEASSETYKGRAGRCFLEKEIKTVGRSSNGRGGKDKVLLFIGLGKGKRKTGDKRGTRRTRTRHETLCLDRGARKKRSLRRGLPGRGFVGRITQHEYISFERRTSSIYSSKCIYNAVLENTAKL
jgi:hypothetical protein